MKIIPVKCENCLAASRVGYVEIGNEHFQIPAPMLTDTELNYMRDVINNNNHVSRFPHKVFEIRVTVNSEKLLKILNDADEQKSFIDTVKLKIERSKDVSNSEVSLLTFIMGSDVRLDERGIDGLVNIQLDCGLEVINIPDSPMMTANTFVPILKKVSKRIQIKNKEPFLLISMDKDLDEFSSKIELSLPFVSGITAIYVSDITRYSMNFNFLMQLKVQNPQKLRILSNVDRAYGENGSLYPLSFLVSDLYSFKRGFAPKYKPKPADLRIFSEKLLGYVSLQELEDEVGIDMGCSCSICKDRSIGDFSQWYSNCLYSAFRVHETFAVYNFNRLAIDFNLAGELLDFLEDKKYAMETLNLTFFSNSLKKQLHL